MRDHAAGIAGRGNPAPGPDDRARHISELGDDLDHSSRIGAHVNEWPPEKVPRDLPSVLVMGDGRRAEYDGAPTAHDHRLTLEGNVKCVPRRAVDPLIEHVSILEARAREPFSNVEKLGSVRHVEVRPMRRP